MRSFFAAAVVALAATQPALAALTVTPETNATNLATTLLTGTGLSVNSSVLAGHTLGNGASTSGVYTVVGAGPYSLTGSGIVLSTGDVRDYASPNPNAGGINRGTEYRNGNQGYFTNLSNDGVPATAAQEMLLDPITGGSFNHFDVTQLDVNFTLDANRNAVVFDVVFGSEEFFEFVNSNFDDGFGLYVNGTNIAFSNGIPIDISHPDMMTLGGTELDGVLAAFGGPIQRFAFNVGFGASGTLTFVLGDAGDGIYDTTIYARGLAGAVIPEPAACLVFAAALVPALVMAAVRKRKRRSV